MKGLCHRVKLVSSFRFRNCDVPDGDVDDDDYVGQQSCTYSNVGVVVDLQEICKYDECINYRYFHSFEGALFILYL